MKVTPDGPDDARQQEQPAPDPPPARCGPSGRVLELGDTGRQVAYLRQYLHRFGYLRQCPCPEEVFCRHVKSGVLRYQRFFGLTTTGILDQATQVQLAKPRCGVADMDPDDPDPPTNGDYNLSGGSWSSTSLRFFFDNGTSDISGTGERDIVRRAFQPWAAVTPLRFAETATESDAQFSFGWRTGDHGDGSSFDGSGNIYAHGFYPPPVNSGSIAGDVHFDDAEEWDSEDGGWWFWKRIDLETVAVHEIGHALGLKHSSVGDAVMWPSYEGERRSLHADDVAGIQAIYGPPTVPARSEFGVASMWALKSSGSYGSVTIDLGRRRRFLAWASMTMLDSLNNFDRDNAVTAEIFKVDGNETWRAIYGGDHFGGAGDASNVHQGAYVGYGRRITFRLRSMNPRGDLEAFGAGTVVTLDALDE
ncbi:M10 family metallopeptidase domain-containing protein [Arthrobacter castelli]|uniref:M10 family metallopeptidase domain-containing protein n=1 Tax=Arthrobacter castelli TaxID=271431 RepID=UPI000417AB3B|nr:matrixin family metalloprotease [Arthrobacter castelli]